MRSNRGTRPSDTHCLSVSLSVLVCVSALKMGQGIGVVTAVNAKLSVLLVDNNAAALQRATGFIRGLLEKDMKKGKMTAEECEAAVLRMQTSTDMGALKETDFVIEAASENVDLKKKIFKDLSSQSNSAPAANLSCHVATQRCCIPHLCSVLCAVRCRCCAH